MTQNQRISLNIVATYGRSLFALLCGVFTTRWVLMALGKSDYGLYGLVGGLAAFVAFFNNRLSDAIGRFYAVSVGRSKVSANGLEECRKWFATAVTVHTILPLILVVIGYPIGAWAVRNFLTIPSDRVEVCVWVWRFACANCFLHMASAPYGAMYRAKQEIAELTIYSVASSVVGFFFIWYMVEHPGDWLFGYSFGVFLIGIVPTLMINIRALFVYPECRLQVRYLFDFQRIRQLMSFAGWTTIGALGSLLKTQGIAIIINKYFGPVVNAANTVGTSLSNHCNDLSASMVGAFSPAVMNAYGAGEIERARMLAYRACKFGTLFILIFAIPMMLEVDEVLHIWLKDPPQYAAGLAICVMITVIINKTAIGHVMLVNARGKIALYQVMVGGSILMACPVAWLFVELDWGAYAVGWAMILTMIGCVFGRVWLARGLVGMSARYWLFKILLPILVLSVACGALGLCPRLFMDVSIIRIFVTTILVEIVLLPGTWFLLLDQDEKFVVRAKIGHHVVMHFRSVA